MAQTFPNQLFHTAPVPLDSSQEVNIVEDLTNASKTVGYPGKLVHVKGENKTYLCTGSERDPSTGTTRSTWTPIFNDAGTEFYLRTTDTGAVVKLSAVAGGEGNVPRILVTYPGEV